MGKASGSALEGGKMLAKGVLLDVVFPRAYRRAAAATSLNPRKVVFVEVRESSLSDSFRLLHDRLVDRGYDVQVAFLEYHGSDYVQYYRNCRAMIDQIAAAPVVFLNDACNVIGCLPLRAGTRVVQTWHACGAFKKWGMSTADLKFGGSRAQKERHPHYGNLSLVTTSAPEVNWAYVEAMHLEDCPQIVKALGVSRTDVFFDPAWLERARARVEEAIPQAQGKKILLYAPTFRGRVATAEGPDALDIPALKRALGKTHVLLVKHHPFVKRPPELPADCADFAFDVSSGALAIDALMAAADLCLSDYSSIVFEYSLLRRPIAFFAFDREAYSDWRGFYYDYADFTPGPVFGTTTEVADWARSCEQAFDSAEVDAFRDRFMSACDGHATERILAEVFG